MYHYTATHLAKQIGKKGTIEPRPQPYLDGLEISWWTDVEPKSLDPEMHGLTSHLLPYSRVACCYVADDVSTLKAWQEWWPLQSPKPVRDRAMALGFGKSPSHWWISEHPVNAERIR